MRVAVVGCGLIGRRRAEIVELSPTDELVVVADVDGERGMAVAEEMGCQATTDWQEVVGRGDVEAIVVSTPNKHLMPIAVAALEHGKHVLCEKPPGRNANETSKMAEAAQRSQRMLKVGFNHRHHPAIWKAHEVCSRGSIGPLMFIRAVYGHGGRPGYEKEWRGDAALAGGGELLDQGVHIVDLCLWFMGSFAEAVSYTQTHFWDLGCFPSDGRNPPRRLEDNAFVLLRTSDGRVAQWHTSWTQWKNCFSFEVYGHDGYVGVQGLGGSYGAETLTIGHRRLNSGPPIEEHFEFSGPDVSWQSEWDEFTSAIREKRRPLADVEDGLAAMQLMSAIYESAHTGSIVRV